MNKTIIKFWSGQRLSLGKQNSVRPEQVEGKLRVAVSWLVHRGHPSRTSGCPVRFYPLQSREKQNEKGRNQCHATKSTSNLPAKRLSPVVSPSVIPVPMSAY